MAIAVFILLMLLALALPLTVLIFWFWRPFYTVTKAVPGPPSFPVIGLLWFPMLNWADWPTVCAETSRRFHHATWGGPCLRYGAVFYTDRPANVKHILKDNHDNYEKGVLWRSIFREILGNGIFNADGPIWASHRKISAKLFSPNLLKYSCQAVDRNCRIIIQQFEDALVNTSGKKNLGAEGATTSTTTTEVDLQDLFLRFTIDNTAETTFGFSMHSLQAPAQSSFATAFDELQDLCLARMIDPFFAIKRMFQLTAAERRIRALQQDLRNFCRQIIKEKQLAIQGGCERQNGREESTSSHEDLLGLFVRYGTKHDNDAEVMEELTDVILNFMVAGRDTTAAALSWIFYELSKNPTVVQRIISEAEQVFGPTADTTEYSFEGLNRLKYIHCVVLEALRLHPPVPVDSKFAIRDDILPDGTFIPAKSLITYMPYAMGHNGQIYGSDVLEFRPERFFDSSTATLTAEPSPYSFTVFNAGPRLCLGKPLAMLTMKMVLVQLLPRFQFHDAIGHSGAMKWSLVGKMKGGYPVQVSRRRSKHN